MKAGLKKRMAAAVAAASAMAALVVATPGTSHAAPPRLLAFGISADGTLMAAFNTDDPGTLNWFKRIDGLVGDTAVVGLDFRVQNGLLYLVGNKGGIYTVQIPPAVPNPLVTKVSQLSVPLQGTNFGVDFNPAADRLRIISDTGQNLAHNLANSSTATNTPLTTDGATTHGVTGAAYTNNDLNSATATTLFDINTTSDQVVIQSPPANGLLVPTGSLGFDAGVNAGFDIFSDLSAGKTISNTAFATLTPAGASTSTFYTVDVLTGATTSVDQFPIAITDVAVSLDMS
ncbi:DUF4394 domain-containing protein [Streptomyces phaeochromogenes]|jgi:hypothetical protein|uniref:DUF4394 domain-containing protein n=1 Tax=Streptomyces phaeochromogenes TaxID=1923 RepID=A0ABZ1H500_STRPH|nr:DUF4394 domain-containing protein [Streptomyces phaeochromogenes]MCX5599928.1 DUF4394 domain-containing protein [Streptomyces phaeochromogenes]WRZ27673.1 DUF4394 domain-containing protein [Streptomyces phaeochromogenes]WSD13235.1 DUF4394 domain-containing protein [Streptomyces phaeochromogenes]WSJ09819.1 DUF4394 domain-containing protein [Streptomyces phaeochromogenes]WSW19342.1 DUF4394 domain-containing protein [Streptomyces phaeochromogenes]